MIQKLGVMYLCSVCGKSTELKKRETFLVMKTTPNTENHAVPGDLVRAKKLKQFVPVSERCLHLWHEKGIIPGYKIGSTVFFSVSEVMGAIKKGGNK